jgi:YVTN family beta-propeller protein
MTGKSQHVCRITTILVAFTLAMGCRHGATGEEKRVVLPSGWSLTPAGRQIALGGMPLKLVPLAGGKHVLAMSNGYTEHFIAVIDVANEKIVQRVPIAEGWLGLAVSADGRAVYASGGSRDQILVYRFDNGKLTAAGGIALPKGTFPAGLALNRSGSRLYVTGNLTNALLVVDLATQRVNATIPVGNKPYACAVADDEQTVYVSNWGEDSVAVVDMAAGRVRATIKVQEKPNDLLLTRDGRRLFVANGNRNTVSVIDAAAAQVTEQIDVGIAPAAPLGSTPNALALSRDGHTMYVANADNNAVAVIDVEQPGHSIARGFIPAGWYPSAVCLVDRDSKLLIANGKGARSQPNAPLWQGSAEGGRKSLGDAQNPGYIGRLIEGTVSVVDVPDAPELARLSQQVHRNSPYTDGHVPPSAPFALGNSCPIRHVIYIIKENRTYDQVFGDIKEGNGDPELCLFPEEVTPNHHALVREFVLFDNFFHNAEVSADGHHWVTSAYATDYVQKFWPSMYSGRGRKERLDLHDDPVAYSAGGFIWDLCAKAGLSYCSYGEGARVRGAEKGKVRPATPSLVGHHHPTYRGADAVGAITDLERFELWAADLREYEARGEMPRFQVLSLPNDHTLGTRPGKPTPRAMMADNDLALGKIVDAVAHSRFWKDTAIFVVEDDAQNGPDHVDCHRTVALVVSPYTRRHAVDSTPYSSSSLLLTMEQILGLPPLTQYDASATPLWKAFRAEPDLTPYVVKPNRIPLDEMNVAAAFGSQRSLELTLEDADSAPEAEFNEIIWKAVRGAGSPLPPRQVAAFVMERKSGDDDD